MAYTTDYTWVTGEVVTAAMMQDYLSNNIKWLSTDKPMARAYNSAVLATTDGVAFACTFDSERFDNAGMHSTTGATGRLTANTAGKYLVGVGITWAVSTTGDYRVAAIRANTTNIAYDARTPGGTNGLAGHTLTTFYAAAATDWFDVLVQQNSGGGLNVAYTPLQSPEFWAVWIGF